MCVPSAAHYYDERRPKEFRYNADDWSSFDLFVPRIRAHSIYLFHYSWFHLQHQQIHLHTHSRIGLSSYGRIDGLFAEGK